MHQSIDAYIQDFIQELKLKKIQKTKKRKKELVVNVDFKLR